MVDINKVDITPCTFLDHDAMKLEVESKKKYWTYQKYVEIMNFQIENEWSNQEIKEEIWNKWKWKHVSPNLWVVAKAVLRGKYIAIQAYLKKEEVSTTQPNPTS